MKFSRRRFIKVGGICIFLALCESGRGEETVWQVTADPGGNGGCTFTAIDSITGHMFTDSDMSRSMFRSNNKGDSWRPIANPITGTPFWVAGDPKEPFTIYMNQLGASAESSGIWRSTDDGDTWVQICQSNRFGKNNSSGIVDPENAKTIYATAADRGVLRSVDGGVSWRDWSAGLPKEKLKNAYPFAHKLKIDENGAERVFYPMNLGLYEASTTDGNWRLAPGLPASVCSDVAACGESCIYAVFPGSGLYISRDDGETWQKQSNGLEGKSIIRVAATHDRPDIVYVSTAGEIGDVGRQAIYGSRDYGSRFEILSDAKFHEGMNWVPNYRQEEGVSARELFVDPHDPLTVYVIRGMKSTDGGRTWRHYGMKEVSPDRWEGTGLPLLTEYRAVFDPNRRNFVWLGYSDTGLMLSEDGGETVNDPRITHSRGEVNQLAYWRDRLVPVSASCVSMAVDPDLSTTVYGSISGKTMAIGAGERGGMVIKTVDDGWNWIPIYEKNGLGDGIVRGIVIDPSSPVHDRTVYVASFSKGVYKSIDDGKTFRSTTSSALLGGNTRLMGLQMASSDPQTLYLAVGGSNGIRPLYMGPDSYPMVKPGMYGGVFRTGDGGRSWEKCNKTREIPSVQDVAIDPTNPKIVYAAAYSENYLVPEGSPHPEWRQGGVFRSIDGGDTWERVFASPNDTVKGKGEVQGICINPVDPDILYIAVENFGIYGTYDSGKTWQLVGQASMDRLQRRFHSIEINPHDPAEVWVAHFGTGFSKGIDYRARKIMEGRFLSANFIRDPGFEEFGRGGPYPAWKVGEPPVPAGGKPVVSASAFAKGGHYSLWFNLTPAYPAAPSTIPGEVEEKRLEDEGLLPGKGRRSRGETESWVQQKINPYFTTLMRGQRVALEMDVFIAKGSPSRPEAFLSEARDYNVQWVDVQTYLSDVRSALGISASAMKGKWYHVKSIGSVTERAEYLTLTVSGVGAGSSPVEAYVDNVRVSLVP